MYSRMMMASRRVAQAAAAGANGDGMRWARRELYRGQCNCAYWHGAFGGIYLPHLRNAVFNHIIAAENLVDEAEHKQGPWVEATADDYNFDLRQEVRLAGDKLICLFAPAAGGMLYELDVRSICHNLLATITRRPEAYHRKVLGGAKQGDGVASIHDRVVFKQQGLDQQLQYDTYARKSLIDHFLGDDATLDDVAAGRADERGDFIFGRYEAQLLRNPGRVQVRMVREGTGCDVPLKITKAVTLEAGGNVLEIAYRIDGLPKDRTLHFAVEFGFAGLPADADDRYFYDADRKPIGQLGTRLDLTGVHSLGLVDKWLGVDVGLSTNRPTNFWTFPIAAVSQSEGGYELVHQSVVVLPHWHVEADENGSWTVRMHMAVDTSLAESRMEEQPVAAAGL
jgi:alpha-amylase